jgi:hypothetical protein
MTALKLTKELRLFQAGIKVPEDTGSNIIGKPQNQTRIYEDVGLL